MCLMIVSGPDTVVSHDHIVRTVCNNPDGWGIAYLRRGHKPVIVRSTGASERTNAELAWRVWNSFRSDTSSVCFIHARRCVSGEVSDQNTMPIPINVRRGLYLAHNGMGAWPIVDHRSDTWHTAKYFARFSVEQIIPGMEDFANIVGGRFALITPERIHTFGDWTLRDGVRYSNPSLVWSSTTYPIQGATLLPSAQTFHVSSDQHSLSKRARKRLARLALRNGPTVTDDDLQKYLEAKERAEDPELDAFLSQYEEEHGHMRSFRGVRRIKGMRVG